MDIKPMTRLPSEQAENFEEALSELYECREEQITRFQDVKKILEEKVRPKILDDLLSLGAVVIADDAVKTTPSAEATATHVIRRKRLAERLLKDVLNLNDDLVDPAACQWEHILSQEVTNSICTLLGHPTLSPKDKPIPPGACCQSETKEVAPVICSLDNMGRGDHGKITYLMFKKNPDLYRLLSMGLIPGTRIEVLQRTPTFVVQANETQMAFDQSIAEAIYVHPLNGKG